MRERIPRPYVLSKTNPLSTRLKGFVLRLRDGFDADLGVRLTVTDVAAVPRLWLVLDDRDLFATSVFDDLGSDDGTGNNWRTDLDRIAVGVCHKHRFEGECFAFSELDFFNGEHLAFSDQVLLSTRGDDCVHKRLCWAGDKGILVLFVPVPSQNVPVGYQEQPG